MAQAAAASGRANALRTEIVVGVRVPCAAPREDVYDMLTDLPSHLDWAGERRPGSSRLLTMEAPEGPAQVGTEFRSTGSDPMGTFRDESVVTEATRPSVFEFVTEAVLATKQSKEVRWTNVSRYELEAAGDGCTIRASVRVARISELAGMLTLFRIPVVSGLVIRMARSSVERTVRNLAEAAEERAAEGRTGRRDGR